MKILVIGDPHGKLSKKFPKKVDFILITGDIGKADLARKFAFKNIEREKKGFPELKKIPAFEKKVWMEIYNSTVNVLKKLSKIAPTYSILGNVGTSTDSEIKKEGKKLGIKLPLIRTGMNKIKNFHLVRNRLRNIEGISVGFLEYFNDVCWIREFKANDKKKIKLSKKETVKAKKVLRNFKNLDILVCHQPPYGILDKVNFPGAPKHWQGKHAGSKVILDYIKKKQPKYVFCGHIHEGKGKKKIGKTQVYNVGVSGDYVVVDIE